MGPITAVFGALLIALGLFAYFWRPASITALIPAFLGLPILILGLLARKDNLRKHAMHTAAALGLIGFLVPAVMAFPKLPTLLSAGEVRRADGSDATFAVIVQLLMAVLCGLFVGLCVKSFIDARRARARRETQESALGS
ncbi:MAG TPA: hypothetical protein VNK04_09370 [Gemmataceae bacterium]|nr:hypothetical protein [Gemmataceae bacterium]